MRTIWGMGILLGGIAVALLFRHNTPTAEPPTPGVSERLVLREQAAPSVQDTDRPEPPPTHGSPPAPPSRPAPPPRQTPAILAPMDTGQPPPALARVYPHDPSAGSPLPGPSMGAAPVTATQTQAKPQTHRIADGDTLEALAQRYLGRADRAAEIYEANRNVLAHPDILPIGAELKIPPRSVDAPRPSEPTGRPLAPIPPAP